MGQINDNKSKNSVDETLKDVDQNSAQDISQNIDLENTSEDSSDIKTDESLSSVKIEFPYSEVVRAQIPKTFDVVEKAATDWKNEGDFSDIGIQHPVAGVLAAQVLQQAKKVEKKLEEKGVISIAKMGFQIAKSQLEQITKKKS